MSLTIRSSSAVQASPVSPKPEVSFGYYHPTSIVNYRDGGSIKMTGNLNKSVEGEIFLDGAINSPTRGTIYGSTRFWNKPQSGERFVLSDKQLFDVYMAIATYQGNHPDAHPAYQQLKQKIGDKLGLE